MRFEFTVQIRFRRAIERDKIEINKPLSLASVYLDVVQRGRHSLVLSPSDVSDISNNPDSLNHVIPPTLVRRVYLVVIIRIFLYRI